MRFSSAEGVDVPQERHLIAKRLMETSPLRTVPKGDAAILFENGTLVHGSPADVAKKLARSDYPRQARIVLEHANPAAVIVVVAFSDGGALTTMWMPDGHGLA